MDKIFKYTIIIIFILASSAIYGESVFLKNGSIVEGKVQRQTDRYTVVKSSQGYEIKIKRQNILRTLYNDDYKEKKYIYKFNGKTIVTFIIYEDKNYYYCRDILLKNDEYKIPKNSVNFVAKSKVKVLEVEKKNNNNKKASESEKLSEKSSNNEMRLDLTFMIGAAMTVPAYKRRITGDEMDQTSDHAFETFPGPAGDLIFNLIFNKNWSLHGEYNFQYFNPNGEYIDIPQGAEIKISMREYYHDFSLMGGYNIGSFTLLFGGAFNLLYQKENMASSIWAEEDFYYNTKEYGLSGGLIYRWRINDIFVLTCKYILSVVKSDMDKTYPAMEEQKDTYINFHNRFSLIFSYIFSESILFHAEIKGKYTFYKEIDIAQPGTVYGSSHGFALGLYLGAEYRIDL